MRRTVSSWMGTLDVAEVDEAEADGAARANAGEGDFGTLRSVIDHHRRNIARDAGVAPEKVRIDIDFN